MANKYEVKTIRASTVLTNSYVAATVIGQNDNNQIQELNQLVLEADFTIWSLTSLEIKIEFSDDGVTYRQETFSSISWGTDTLSLWEHTCTATGVYEIATPFKAKFVKVSAKGTWTVTSSLLTLKATVWVS